MNSNPFLEAACFSFLFSLWNLVGWRQTITSPFPMSYVAALRMDNRRFPSHFCLRIYNFLTLVHMSPNSTNVTLSWNLMYTAVCKLLPSLWSKQWNRKTLPFSDWPQSLRVDPARYISSPAPLHCPALCSSYWNIDFYRAGAHTLKNQYSSAHNWTGSRARTNSEVQQALPAGLGRGGVGGLDETMPKERPLQSREGSDKPRVQRKEKGEWKSSLRIKQLEGAMIYLSIGGNGEKERVN